jgi:hypothetical protein
MPAHAPWHNLLLTLECKLMMMIRSQSHEVTDALREFFSWYGFMVELGKLQSIRITHICSDVAAAPMEHMHLVGLVTR